MATSLDQVLERTLAALPVTRDDLLVRGIAEVTERIVELKKTATRLQEKYGSRDALQERIEREGVPANDHTLYTDLMEWNSIESDLKIHQCAVMSKAKLIL